MAEHQGDLLHYAEVRRAARDVLGLNCLLYLWLEGCACALLTSQRACGPSSTFSMIAGS